MVEGRLTEKESVSSGSRTEALRATDAVSVFEFTGLVASLPTISDTVRYLVDASKIA